MQITVLGGFGVGKTIHTARAPEAGETVSGGVYSEGPGGKASNQAVQIARLGVPAALITAVGEDQGAELGRQLWKTEGVSAERVITLDAPTMVGFIIVDDSGENRIALAPGALEKMTPADLEPLRDLIESSSALVVSFELTPDVGVKALEWAHQVGVRTICNPAPAMALQPEVLRTCDVFVPNYGEACQVLGLAADGTHSPEELAESLRERGARSVVITLGSRGAYVLDQTFQGFVDPVTAEVVVDTTGAGDSFVGGLAVGLDAGLGLRDAAEFAASVAAITVQTPEVIPALPYAHQVRVPEGAHR